MAAVAMRKSHEERREEIARMALALAAERGAAAVSTQSIADALGVSQATVFRHFKTRDEVFHEAFAVVRADVHATLGPIFEDKTQTAAKRLHRLVEAHLGFIQDNRGIPALLFSDSLYMGDAALKAQVRDLMKGYAGRVASLVLDGVRDGSIDKDADPALVGQALVTLIQGLALRWALFDHAFDLKTQAEVAWLLLKPAISGQSKTE